MIKGRLAGLNEYTNAARTNRFRSADLKREMNDFILWQIRGQLRGYKADGKVYLRFDWYEPNRRRDMDNVAFAKKFVQDALVNGGYLKNDGWKHVVGFSDSFHIDKDDPRVEVEIVEVEGDS